MHMYRPFARGLQLIKEVIAALYACVGVRKVALALLVWRFRMNSTGSQ